MGSKKIKQIKLKIDEYINHKINTYINKQNGEWIEINYRKCLVNYEILKVT